MWYTHRGVQLLAHDGMAWGRIIAEAHLANDDDHCVPCRTAPPAPPRPPLPVCRATGALKRALPEAYRDEQQYDEQLLHAAYSDIRGQVARMSGSPSGTLDHVLAARAQAIQPDGAAATAVITPRL